MTQALAQALSSGVRRAMAVEEEAGSAPTALHNWDGDDDRLRPDGGLPPSSTPTTDDGEPAEDGDGDGDWLPQPSPDHRGAYRYVCVHHVRPLNPGGGGLHHDQLVWVCKSKGKGKSQHPSLPGNSGRSSPLAPSEVANTSQQRLELFLRARVVLEESQPRDGSSPSVPPTEDDGRVLVRYPRGSTYRVRRECLIHVWEYERRLVAVVPETPAYRKCCAVHALPHESVLEIGSDLGFNVRRLFELPGGDPGRIIVGVDKSEHSVREASASFPHLTFVQWDPLEDSTEQLLRQLRRPNFHPDVVAIDINGNRELPAVLSCLNAVFNVHGWEPRLIIVKSRALHARLIREAATANADEAAGEREEEQ